jgi:DNA-binding PadR family transcriptional regulator
MKGDSLGEFEELTLLAVRAIKDEAYGVPVQRFVEKATGRNITMGSVYSALTRLEAKGYLRSVMSAPMQVRGGKGRRVFEVTAEGTRTLKSLRRVRDRIWRAIESDGSL